MFAVMLLVRLGPICEASAQAGPIASAMAECEDKGPPAPGTKAQQPACATPCIAIPGEAVARVAVVSLPSIAPMPSRASKMAGRLASPETPPLQAV